MTQLFLVVVPNLPLHLPENLLESSNTMYTSPLHMYIGEVIAKLKNVSNWLFTIVCTSTNTCIICMQDSIFNTMAALVPSKSFDLGDELECYLHTDVQ